MQSNFIIMLWLCHYESIMFHFIIQSGLGICPLTYNHTLEWYLDVLHQGVTLVLVVLAAPLTAW